MKSILISIRPQWVAKILNGEKTIEIRKKFPKDYVGWVYIYCTSHNNHRKSLYELETYKKKRKFDVDYYIPSEPDFIFNGKVVARFWCDKVEHTYNFYPKELCSLACITEEELYKYAGVRYNYDELLVVHITKLEIFDKSKEISEFDRIVCGFGSGLVAVKPLTCAPQSWCYVEESL